MKKIFTVTLLAVSLVATSGSAFAAGVKKPTIAAKSAKEGTAKHESAETQMTQKSEAKASAKSTSKVASGKNKKKTNSKNK